MEHAGLRTPIMMLRHITRARAKQILSPCVIALQVAFARSVEKTENVGYGQVYSWL